MISIFNNMGKLIQIHDHESDETSDAYCYVYIFCNQYIHMYVYIYVYGLNVFHVYACFLAMAFRFQLSCRTIAWA